MLLRTLLVMIVFGLNAQHAFAESETKPVQKSATTAAKTPAKPVNLSKAIEVRLWATIYYLFEAAGAEAGKGIPLRDMKEEVLGPELAVRHWCTAALQGAVRIGEITYNYAGTRHPRQTDCANNPSEFVRWVKTAHPFGTGSRDNALIPFKTLACDMGTERHSRRWLHGRHARFGQQIYIPDAVGTVLPDGSKHDGLFVCGDTGGMISGNHIDVFIGGVQGGPDAAIKANPFSFVTSTPRKTFKAYVLP